MDRLRPLDAAFLEAEDQDRHISMAIGSLAIFEGPAPGYEEFLSAIEERLPLVPRYRQRLRTVPLHLGYPGWEDDPRFDLRFHVRRAALPAPGGQKETEDFVAEVMSHRLDRDRPLWEYWMVTGLAGGRWALLSKIHHCMVDGVSGTDLYRVMFDPDTPTVPAGTLTSSPEATTGMLLRSLLGILWLPVRDTTAALRRALHPRDALTQAETTVRATVEMRSALLPARPSSLSGPIGKQRRYRWVRVSLDEVRSIKNRLGGTVNDVVLAAITSGFRALLESRAEALQEHMVPSLVPVSVRAPGTENIYDNEVSAMIVDLPVHLPDPLEQLATVRAELEKAKRGDESRAGQAVTELAARLPYQTWAALVRIGFALPQREIVTVTTNIPGPRKTLYCLGRPMVEITPYVPIGSTVRIGVAIFSYRHDMTFGITGDYDTTADIDVLTAGIEHAIGALAAAAAVAAG